MYLYQLCKAKAKLLGYVSYDIRMSVHEVPTRSYCIHVRPHNRFLLYLFIIFILLFDSLIVIIFVIGSFYCLASRLVLAAVPVVTVGAEKRDWLIEPSGFG